MKEPARTGYHNPRVVHALSGQPLDPAPTAAAAYSSCGGVRSGRFRFCGGSVRSRVASDRWTQAALSAALVGARRSFRVRNPFGIHRLIDEQKPLLGPQVKRMEPHDGAEDRPIRVLGDWPLVYPGLDGADHTRKLDSSQVVFGVRMERFRLLHS